jgi:cytochrome d ubiquinol oxidase subunit I
MLRMGLGLALVLAPAQLVIGDFHGLVTEREQPAKIAAIEAHWDSDEVAPLELFAWPDPATETDDYSVALPHVGSLIITHDWDGKFTGLKSFAPQDRPPVAPVFFAFRAMVGIGLMLIVLVFWGGISWWRGGLFENRAFLRAASWAWPLGFIAIISGWIVTEVGRQPWVVTGVLRTADATSPVAPEALMISLVLFVLVYGIVFTTGLVYVNRLIRTGPLPAVLGAEEGLPSRPPSGAERAARGATETRGGETRP